VLKGEISVVTSMLWSSMALLTIAWHIIAIRYPLFLAKYATSARILPNLFM
jgi:hypothetical protein